MNVSCLHAVNKNETTATLLYLLFFYLQPVIYGKVIWRLQTRPLGSGMLSKASATTSRIACVWRALRSFAWYGRSSHCIGCHGDKTSHQVHLRNCITVSAREPRYRNQEVKLHFPFFLHCVYICWCGSVCLALRHNANGKGLYEN